MSRHFVFTTKTTQPRRQGNFAARLTSSVHISQNSSKFGRQWLVMMNYAWDFSQSEKEKYFEWIIIVFIIDVSRERKDKQIDPLSLRMPLLTTLPSWSRRQRETALFGVVAKTWVFNFHFNQFRFVAFTLATRILQIIVLKLPLFSLSHISSSISKLCYLNF